MVEGEEAGGEHSSLLYSYFHEKVCIEGLALHHQKEEGGGMPDDALTEYLVSLLVEEDSSDEDCASALAAYLLPPEDDEDVGSQQQRPLLSSMKEGGEAMRLARAEMRAIVVAQKQKQEEEWRRWQAEDKRVESGPEVEDEEATAPEEGGAGQEEEEDDLAFLYSLVPDVPRPLVHFVYAVECCRSKEAAAERLVAGASPEGMEDWRQKKLRWEEEERGREAQEREEAKKLKDRLCQRFAMEQVRSPDDGACDKGAKGATSSVLAAHLNAKKKENDKKVCDWIETPAAICDNPVHPCALHWQRPTVRVMYRDGEEIRVKGKEKYIVEDLTPEWDGGSKGRIKTKGKRGTGWK